MSRRFKKNTRNNAFLLTATLRQWGERITPIFFLVLAGFIFLATALNDNFERQIRVGLSDLTAPALQSVAEPLRNAALSVNAVSNVFTAMQDNQQLRAENQRLRKWYQMALSLKVENESLSKMVNLVEEPDHSFITTRVITDPSVPFYKNVLTPAGQSEGVKQNHAALAPEGLIGRISDVGERSSRILMATDINSRIPVFVGNKKGRAILAGNNSNMPILDHIAKGTDVQIGDHVMTSGQGGIFAPGVPVGVIEAIDEQGQIQVRLFADPATLDYIQIVDFGLSRKFY